MADKKNIQEILKTLPEEPGVYLMKNSLAEIIYIGKAASLKKRVSSYFHSKEHDPKTSVLVKTIDDIEYIVTNSEIEALLLENTLIKKHKPRFNIRLKDDKRYPYIEVTLDETFPRIRITRKISSKMNRYFGPFTDAGAARSTVTMINRLFKLKTCTRSVPLKNHERPCLNFQMKRCAGICRGTISQDEYRTLIDRTIEFLEGHCDPVLKKLNDQMNNYSEKFEYEKAASIRDIIFDVQKISEDQKVSLPSGFDRDYLCSGIRGDEAVVVLFQFREGSLTGRNVRFFSNATYSNPEEIIQTFILDHYRRAEIPAGVTCQVKPDDKEVLEKFLQKNSGKAVRLLSVKSSDDRSVISMIRKNIDHIFSERIHFREQEGLESLKELADVLGINKISIMECFDISNIQGTLSVASMVQFKNGYPNRKNYRRYRIRGYQGANDPGMIHEAVARRLQHLINENLPLPDLIVIDGGTTQLKRAIEARNALGLDLPVISIAKRLEEIFYDPVKPSLLLERRSSALKLIQRIRDEAHRFAVTYHRDLRSRRLTSSVLDTIHGLGPEIKKRLLSHFKSIEDIKNSDMQRLLQVKGLGTVMASKILKAFKEDHDS